MTRSRLTPEREGELFGAVLDLLREVGYDALTMDAIAARTRSSKATLYRQWGGKPELVAKALRELSPHNSSEVDTGSLRGDFHAMVCRGDDAEMARDTALLRGLFQAIHTHPDLHRALREQLVEPDSGELQTVVRRAVERGEIREDNPAKDFLPHMLLGVFFAREVVDVRPPDIEFLRQYVDAVVLPALEA
ncbi:TetR family transcriptional regulator [Streptomyces inusitatus]|uniref:TetR family transcriptional regulator n=1 Tax=Streptomyces inusitatus TaxID=68221 RepID=A0A918PVA1_9ACTN|nr:TetR/AcrR family transcriptional regulator [Streptomyces inusitatus]GGZ24537.1 TetR family transcriptional regulator [Streptomyces inusitatus]